MSKIVIVDDDIEILNPLEEMLKDEGFEVRAFSNPLKALDFFRTQNADLAIFDIKMPELNGFDLLRQVRAIPNEIPVIFLSSVDDEYSEVAAFTLSASDYITKPFTKMLLILRVKSVLRRHAPPQPVVEKPIEVGDLYIDRERHLVSWRGESIDLTVTECLLLISLAERPGIVKKRQQLMDACYEGAIVVGERSIDSHIRNVRAKFRAVDEKTEVIGTVQGLGYKLKI